MLSLKRPINFRRNLREMSAYSNVKILPLSILYGKVLNQTDTSPDDRSHIRKRFLLGNHQILNLAELITVFKRIIDMLGVLY